MVVSSFSVWVFKCSSSFFSALRVVPVRRDASGAGIPLLLGIQLGLPFLPQMACHCRDWVSISSRRADSRSCISAIRCMNCRVWLSRVDLLFLQGFGCRVALSAQRFDLFPQHLDFLLGALRFDIQFCRQRLLRICRAFQLAFQLLNDGLVLLFPFLLFGRRSVPGAPPGRSTWPPPGRPCGFSRFRWSSGCAPVPAGAVVPPVPPGAGRFLLRDRAERSSSASFSDRIWAMTLSQYCVRSWSRRACSASALLRAGLGFQRWIPSYGACVVFALGHLVSRRLRISRWSCSRRWIWLCARVRSSWRWDSDLLELGLEERDLRLEGPVSRSWLSSWPWSVRSSACASRSKERCCSAAAFAHLLHQLFFFFDVSFNRSVSCCSGAAEAGSVLRPSAGARSSTGFFRPDSVVRPRGVCGLSSVRRPVRSVRVP